MGYVNETSHRIEEQDGSGTAAVIETLQSIIIAFAIAFVFKHFVAEAYVIPTGSMAPTLNGAHLNARGPDSGFEYAIGPKERGSDGIATQYQTGIQTEDPMLGSGGAPIYFNRAKTRMGDRIFVQRYLYSLLGPKRFDVVVFKYPVDPRQNFIKRLIGLPNESVWLADGDVFAQAVGAERFQIQRKPEHVQRAVWQTVYSSNFIPIVRSGTIAERATLNWQPPWASADFDLSKRYYTSTNAELASLSWRNDRIPITDRTIYNDAARSSSRPGNRFAVSDLRLAAGVVAASAGLRSTIHLESRGHEFEAIFGQGEVVLQMRRKPASTVAPSADPWTNLATVTNDGATLPAGEVINVEFWHVDQSLKLWLDGELIAEAEYDWDARTRLLEATRLDPETLSTNRPYGNEYQRSKNKARLPEIRWDFRGSLVTLYHVELERDLFYRPDTYPRGARTGYPALATHPSSRVSLDGDQFFMCGDNSPASSDGRVWMPPTPWIASRFNGIQGVVPRELILGKAFFVYYPSPEGLKPDSTRFVPNFGRMRLIR